MAKLFPKNSAPTALLLLCALVAACTQVDKTLGEDFVPGGQQQSVQLYNATHFCSFSTVQLDSLNTAGGNMGAGVLGVLYDDRLGRTAAGFATTFMPANGYDFDFGEGVAGFDSAFLELSFPIAAYGSGTDPMPILVYEMQSTIGNVVYGTTVDMDTMIVPTPVSIGSTAVDNNTTQVRIRLSNDLLPRLFRVENADTFAANFKGLYVAVDTTKFDNGCIQYANIIGTTTSGIVAYYTPLGETAARPFAFRVSSANPRFNVYHHSYKALTHPPDVLYAQGLGGVATQLTFDTAAMREWVGSRRIAVNRAELVLPVEDARVPQRIDEQYSPTVICVVRFAEGYTSVLDMYNDALFGGTMNRSQMEYSVNITHTFNDALLKGNNAPVFIVPGSFLDDARSVFISNRDGEKKPQLRIWYTEVR